MGDVSGDTDEVGMFGDGRGGEPIGSGEGGGDSIFSLLESKKAKMGEEN